MIGRYTECDNPNCTNSNPTKTYEGRDGNTVQVCSECYWELVTGEKVASLGIEDSDTTSFEPTIYTRGANYGLGYDADSSDNDEMLSID